MFKKSKMKAVIFSMILCLSVGFVGCSQKKDTAKSNDSAQSESKASEKVAKIKESGKLILGTCADYPPYEFHKIVNGKDEIVGLDVEIAKEIAKELGVKLEIKDMGFDGLIPSLKTGKIDLIISGMTPNEKRAKEVDFSKVYYKAVQKVLIRKEDKAKYKSVADLEGKKVGAQTSSIQEEIAHKEVKDAKVSSLSKVTELVLALKTKKVDAVIVEGPVAKAYADKNNEIMISDMTVGDPDEGSAIAVKKGNSDMVEALNKVIDKLNKEDKINEFVEKANEIAE